MSILALVVMAGVAVAQPTDSHYIYFSGTGHLHGNAYYEAGDQLFITDTTTGSVRRYDGFSTVSPGATVSHAASRSLGTGLQGIAYDPDLDRLYYIQSGIVYVIDRSLSALTSFNPGLGTSASDLTWRDGELFIVSSSSSTVAVYDTASLSRTRSLSLPVTQPWPSIAYDEHTDQLWFSYWGTGAPGPWWSIDPDTGATTSHTTSSGGLWGHGLEYTNGLLLLSTETATTDGVRVMTVDCDDDGDGRCNADDNCPAVANPAQADADGDGDGDACDPCTDVDGDGYGDVTFTATSCDADCDDSDATVNPASLEVCDGVDNDCDGTTDGPTASDASTWFGDADGDGYGDATSATVDCLAPAGTVADDTDCDDGDDTVHPGASELCDGLDNDCDASPAAEEADDDADGFVECTLDAGGWDGATALSGDDCDDTDATVHPGASELCDGQDNDCDGAPQATESDDDADGFVECVLDGGGWDGATALSGEDCDDTDATVHPGASELCDGQDNDCDGAPQATESDDDSDGYVECTVDGGGWDGATGLAGDDCDDASSTVYPGAPEVCDGLDNDCDTVIPSDEQDVDGDGVVACDGDCAPEDAARHPGAEEVPYDGIDQDCDGADLCDVDGDTWDAVECDGEDCDDEDESVYPGAEDVWYDGVDADCEGNSDYDADADGFDSLTHGGEDCDDARDDVYPGAPDEPGDGVVTDCDESDEFDVDGDGHVDVAEGGEDCDDASSAVHPGAEESWYDGVDQDCDGNDDDQDGDGVPLSEDCDDLDPAVVECDSGGLARGKAAGGSECGCSGVPDRGPVGLAAALVALAAVRRRRAAGARDSAL